MIEWKTTKNYNDYRFDEWHFGECKITVYSFGDKKDVSMWFHINNETKIKKNFGNISFEEAHEKAFEIVYEYVEKNLWYWNNILLKMYQTKGE